MVGLLAVYLLFMPVLSTFLSEGVPYGASDLIFSLLLVAQNHNP
jgi:hypothetical protein